MASSPGGSHCRVGSLAQRTGISVRTLHHYDRIGLLRPRARTTTGHRLYGEADLRRLQQILSLKSLGLSLARIREMLDQRGSDPVETLRSHAAQLRERIKRERILCADLERLASRLERSEDVTVDDLLSAIKETKMMEDFKRYYTPEQLETLARRRDAIGPEGIEKAQDDWRHLIAEVSKAVEQGLDPASEEAQGLARRWDALIDAFTGGDEGIRQSLTRMYAQQPDIARDHGYQPDPNMQAFLAKARSNGG